MPSQSTSQSGLFQKYRVERVDGRDQPGGDKDDARYFVLDYVHDRRARHALLMYAEGVWFDNPEFAEDLWRELRAAGAEFKTIPERQAEGAATQRWVTDRLTELYGPDQDKWPKFPQDGR